ncbi:MAG: peptidoglycan DD-metalloendopeptidase family protein [Candidatus Vogelbacteria bacterium]|nr:peptidoglycan DD-metalloendopeptidase family protein [Candidatus Vogelbacteria bacterium]
MLKKITQTKIQKIIWAGLFMVLLFFVFSSVGQVQGATADELRAKIEQQNNDLKKLDAEIAKYQTALATTKNQSSSLKNEIAKIDIARQQLKTEISATMKKLSITELTIGKLGLSIKDKEENIKTDRSIIAEALRQLNQQERQGLTEIILGSSKLSDFLDSTGRLTSLSGKIDEKISDLTNNKKQLEGEKVQTEEQKKLLNDFQEKLADQKKVADSVRNEKDTLLTQTKNKETNYQKLLADRREKKKQVTDEINKAEAELKIVLDPSLLPKAGTNVLGWPLNKIIITQYFGNTDFATRNPGVYNGNGHPGVDFGTPTGSIVKSAADGKVIGIGNTDNTCQGASYGKWILIEHNNGLSTLYGHLSLIKVTEGQTVSQGDTIAYSGNTGYSTGPHLHFTVYASQGVKVGSLKSKVAGCGTYTLPIASHNSYLNPLTYLPAL